MRGWVVLLVVAVVGAGCAQSPSANPSGGGQPLSPLPPPDASKAPEDRVGATVLQDAAYRDAKVGPLPWRNECIRQWSSRAYDYNRPPIVSGKACLFYPTVEGTIFWIVPGDMSDPENSDTRVTAAALPRQDGFFDWVYLKPGTSDLYYQENGTASVLKQASLPISSYANTKWSGISAVRTFDGTIHVGLFDVVTTTLGEIPSTRLSQILHVWWRENAEPSWESISPTAYSAHPPVLRTDGNVVAGYDPSRAGLFASTLLVSRGGAFQQYPLSGTLYDIWVAPGHVYGCLGEQGFLALLDLDADLESTAALPVITPIAPDPFADLGFFCEIAKDRDDLVVVRSIAPLIGGDPSTQGVPGDTVFARRGLTWTTSRFDFFDDYGEEDLTVVNGTALYMAKNGNGTGTGDWREGTPMFAPTSGDATGPWQHHKGNYLDQAWFLQDAFHPSRALIQTSWAANPPFEYHGETRGQRTSTAVLELAWGKEQS